MCRHECFVVLFNLSEVVEVVHHRPGRLFEAFVRRICTGVNVMNNCAISQVEPRNRVKGQSIRRFGVQQVIRGSGAHVFAVVCAVFQPVVIQPFGKVRDWGKRYKSFQPFQFDE